jgi:hypothetical protein
MQFLTLKWFNKFILGATWPLFSFTYWKQSGIVSGGAYGKFKDGSKINNKL